jgi:hypothetical protein
MELLGDVGHMKSLFSQFEDSVSVSTRQVHGLHKMTIGSKIILDAPDRAPRRRGSSGSSIRSVWR